MHNNRTCKSNIHKHLHEWMSKCPLSSLPLSHTHTPTHTLACAWRKDSSILVLKSCLAVGNVCVHTRKVGKCPIGHCLASNCPPPRVHTYLTSKLSIDVVFFSKFQAILSTHHPQPFWVNFQKTNFHFLTFPFCAQVQWVIFFFLGGGGWGAFFSFARYL